MIGRGIGGWGGGAEGIMEEIWYKLDLCRHACTFIHVDMHACANAALPADVCICDESDLVLIVQPHDAPMIMTAARSSALFT